MKTRVLANDDIRTLVRTVGLHPLMDEVIQRLTAALHQHGDGTDVVPARSGFHYSQPTQGLLEWMPSLKVGSQATIKVVGYHPTNPHLHNLPTIVSTVSAYDVTTGHLVGIADATFLTALRTGAASAIASRILASPRSQTVGLIGCGAQALTQLHALSRVLSIEQVFIYDCDPAASTGFLDRAAFLGLEIVPVQAETLAAYVARADVICTATTVEIGAGPVLPDVETRPWLHVNAVGSDFPGKIEIPLSLLRNSVVCPDFLEQALAEGECQQLTPDEIGPTLVELVQHGEHYRDLQERRTVFDSTGWALEDQIAMSLLMEYADDLDLGSLVQLESRGADPKNPYEHLLDGRLPAGTNGATGEGHALHESQR